MLIYSDDILTSLHKFSFKSSELSSSQYLLSVLLQFKDSLSNDINEINETIKNIKSLIGQLIVKNPNKNINTTSRYSECSINLYTKILIIPNII